MYTKMKKELYLDKSTLSLGILKQLQLDLEKKIVYVKIYVTK